MGFIIIGVIFLILVAALGQSIAGRIVLTILFFAGCYVFYWKLTGGGL